jgi:hypothetical protein
VKGTWVFEERKQQWHLLIFPDDVSRSIAARSDEDPVTFVTWCRLELPGPTKSGESIDGIFESVHDECYRKSEELP